VEYIESKSEASTSGRDDLARIVAIVTTACMAVLGCWYVLFSLWWGNALGIYLLDKIILVDAWICSRQI
jgi:hypothetical protein